MAAPLRPVWPTTPRRITLLTNPTGFRDAGVAHAGAAMRPTLSDVRANVQYVTCRDTLTTSSHLRTAGFVVSNSSLEVPALSLCRLRDWCHVRPHQG